MKKVMLTGDRPTGRLTRRTLCWFPDVAVLNYRIQEILMTFLL